jgi:hypothetical protein
MNGAVPAVLLYTFTVCTGMTLRSVRMDVLFSGFTKLFNVYITCNIFCLYTTIYQHSDIVYT